MWLITELFDWMFYRQHVFYIALGAGFVYALLRQNRIRVKELEYRERRLRVITESCEQCSGRIWEDSN